MKTFLRAHDVLSPSISQRFHFDGDVKFKSTLGGFWTLVIYAFMVFYTGNNFWKMIQYQKPYMASVTRLVNYEDDAFIKKETHINDTNFIFFQI